MFTRVVEITTKAGKSHEPANTIQEKVLAILKKQSGFVDETVLPSDMESNRVLALSSWKTKDDAERYHRERYPRATEMLSPLFETAPVIRTFNAVSVRIHGGQAVGRKADSTPVTHHRSRSASTGRPERRLLRMGGAEGVFPCLHALSK